MRKIAVLTVLGALGLVGAAQATKPAHPQHPAKPNPKSCTVRTKGYRSTGTLVTASLTPVAGTSHRFNGTIEVNVLRANHGAATGDQTFTLTNARVLFHGKTTATTPNARVTLHGKITVLPAGCPTTGFTSSTTVTRVDVNKAKKAKA